jgi:transposase
LYFLIGFAYLLLTFQIYMNSKMLHKLNSELKEQLELMHKLLDTKITYKFDNHNKQLNEIHSKLKVK